MVLEFYYHKQSPPSHAVNMVLKELGIEHKAIEVDVFAGKKPGAEYLKTNPLGKVPAIKDGDFVLGDSRAIAIYLCKKYEPQDKKNKLYPTDLEEEAKLNMTIFSDIDNLIHIYRYTNILDLYAGEGDGPIEKKLPLARKALGNMEILLGDNSYIGGNHLTIADFFALYAMVMLTVSDFDKWSEFPKVQKWMKTMEKLPYFEECFTTPVKLNTQYFREQRKKIAAQAEAN